MSNKTDPNWVKTWLESIEELIPSKKEKHLSDFYSSDEIRKLGITCGENCLLAKTTTVVAPEKLVLGHNVRIDGHSVISCGAGITMGSYIHLASHLVLMGASGILIDDYCSIAAGSKILSTSDDLMGRGLVGPCVPLEKRYLHKGKVIMEPHSVLSVNTVMLPGSKLSKGSTVLPFSVYTNKQPSEAFAVYSGTPAVYIKDKRAEFNKLVEETEDDS